MRCARHDLAMAPDGKCVRCRREEEAEEAERGADTLIGRGTVARGPRVAAMLALGGIIAAGLAFAVRPHRPLPSIPSPVVAAAPAGHAASAAPLAPLDPAFVPPDPSAPAAASSAATPLDRAMHEAKIDLYCRSAPPECAQARAWLLGHGYVYKEHNIDGDSAAERALRRIAPGGTVPTFDIDGQAFSGFDPERIQGALEYAGARRLQR